MTTATNAEFLAAILKAHGLTQQDMADRFGVTRKIVNNWVNGRTRVPVHVVFAAERIWRRKTPAD